MIRLASVNVNGIRAAMRKGMGEWLESVDADIVALQEVRATEDILVPLVPGWHVLSDEATAKGRAGVALLSREPAVAHRTDFGAVDFDSKGRWLEGDFEIGGAKITVVSTYVHSGEADTPKQVEKFKFLDAMNERMPQLREHAEHVAIVGDLNVGHREFDIKNWRGNRKKSGFPPSERSYFDGFFGEGEVEAIDGVTRPGHGWADVGRRFAGEVDGPYTWWSNRGQAFDNDTGWRIDYHMVSPPSRHPSSTTASTATPAMTHGGATTLPSSSTTTSKEPHMTKPRIYSGMQPSSGSLHLGNYVGALMQWRELQAEGEAFFSIVDLHALTSAKDPKVLRQQVRTLAAQYIAGGIDPEASCLYVQSHVAAHSQMAWLLSTITGFGEASRMTQFKDKSAKEGVEAANVGLFTYPILMAGDILLYDTDLVPVGGDQKQHVELTRDLAERFNKRFGKTFRVPKPHILGETARIMDLQDPTRKMSKSAETDKGIIWLLDEPGKTVKKIKSAVTDTDGSIRVDAENKPGVTNLLGILSAFTGRPIDDLVAEFDGQGYGAFKGAVAEAVIDELSPIRDRTLDLLDDPAELDRILDANAERASAVADATLDRAMVAMGLR